MHRSRGMRRFLGQAEAHSSLMCRVKLPSMIDYPGEADIGTSTRPGAGDSQKARRDVEMPVGQRTLRGI